tara:strand:+ start:201 stop:413 length:213 start_codon:yes stop_codon:yes gene_type:complete
MKITDQGFRHVGKGAAIIQKCEECGDDLINKNGKFPYKLGWICRHCRTKEKYGASDPKTCFQGSVITLED